MTFIFPLFPFAAKSESIGRSTYYYFQGRFRGMQCTDLGVRHLRRRGAGPSRMLVPRRVSSGPARGQSTTHSAGDKAWHEGRTMRENTTATAARGFSSRDRKGSIYT